MGSRNWTTDETQGFGEREKLDTIQITENEKRKRKFNKVQIATDNVRPVT